VPDIAADRAAGVRTIATRLGARATLAACLVLWLLAAVLLLPWLPALALLGALAYLLLAAASLRAQAGGRPSLFTLYRAFPLVNTALGAALFFAAWFPRQGF
jgi:4-hydroxybenzoate polyprenyltransferase